MAVGIAVAIKCEGCIMADVSNCVKIGVTREELADSLGVNVVIGGGPGVA